MKAELRWNSGKRTVIEIGDEMRSSIEVSLGTDSPFNLATALAADRLRKPVPKKVTFRFCKIYNNIPVYEEKRKETNGK